MARGPSGKLVIEIDPELKDALHARLAREKRTVKQWLVQQAEEYLRWKQALPDTGTVYGCVHHTQLRVAESAFTTREAQESPRSVRETSDC